MTAKRLQNNKRPYALFAFLWAVLTASFIVVPIMIMDNGYFLYYGDFNAQQIPFYTLAHDSILSGNTGWSNTTDLGANFIGSYSFYLLGSPFFWLTMLLPSSAVAYSFGPLLILKLGFCSMSAYIYLRRYVREKKFAVLGGILYAFSGFSIYNVFFFHFHEPMIALPLLLAALDEFHSTKRRGLVALSVLFCAVTNYYFFFGQVVFVIIYYCVKLYCGSYRFKLKEFLALAAECVLGFLMSLFILLPSIAAITGNYRVSEIINGWNAVIYGKTQRYLQIFISLFFPTDVPAKNNFTPSAGGRWSSVAAYIPMFSAVFTVAFLRLKKKSFFSRLVIILLIMAFVPVLNSCFQALNSTYYARWFYMLTLMFAVMAVQGLEDFSKKEFFKGFIPTCIITGAITAIIGLTPNMSEGESGEESLKIGLEASPVRFWAFACISLGGLLLCYISYLIYKKKPKLFFSATAVMLSIFTALYGALYLYSGKSYSIGNDAFLINYALNGGEDIEIDDIKEIRSDFYNTADNMGMYWQIPNIQAFHSIVPESVFEFYNNSGVKRDVNSKPDAELYGFRALLSVKYLFCQADTQDKNSSLMPGFSYTDTQNGYDIFENTCYLPMGFSYDKYICEEEYSSLSDSVKHLALLKAMVLSQQQMEKYADITGYTEGMYDGLNAEYDEKNLQNARYPKFESFDSITSDFRYTENEYYKDVEALQENTCDSFRYTNSGFEAHFDNKGKDDTLLFFSVPYDDGWTAYVNGERAEIEKVNIGFMAVKTDADSESNIVFEYHTPLLKEGIIISMSAAAIFLIYLIFNKGFAAKKKLRKTYKIKQKQK